MIRMNFDPSLVITSSWDCDGQGNCLDPGTGQGTYATLTACQANCIVSTLTSEEVENLNIYPNPTQNVFNISFKIKNSQDLRIRVLNVIGEEIIKDELKQFTGEYSRKVNLKNSSKGIYLLEIKTMSGIINKKIILR